MTATLPARLHHLEPRHVRAAGFEAVLHEGVARAARVVPGEDRLCLVVADLSAGTPAAMDVPVSIPTSSCTVWGHLDGHVQVRASWAPPALLVRASGTSMVPETPGLPGLVSMGSGDRLLVLSSAAFEGAPEMVVRLLHADPGRLMAADADEILHDLFHGSPEAGGAVLTRL